MTEVEMDELQRDLTHAFGEDTAGALLRLFSGDDQADSYESVKKWVRACYHRPAREELILEAANEVLGGFGVEGLRVEGAWVSAYHQDYVASYVNMGDTYSTTLLLDHGSGQWVCGTWGDFLEEYERQQAEEGAG